jgi:hypothetical protein
LPQAGPGLGPALIQLLNPERQVGSQPSQSLFAPAQPRRVIQLGRVGLLAEACRCGSARSVIAVSGGEVLGQDGLGPEACLEPTGGRQRQLLVALTEQGKLQLLGRACGFGPPIENGR